MRGYKAGLLTQAQYATLTQCETLEGMYSYTRVLYQAFRNIPDFRMQLSATDYGSFLANEPLPISTATIQEKSTQLMVDQFQYLRSNAVYPLDKFMDYITFAALPCARDQTLTRELCFSYAYMIDNVILLITGTLHERDTHELLERCHPLGVFDTMPALCVATNVEELYQSVLVETPLGAFSLELIRGSMAFPEERGEMHSPLRIIRTHLIRMCCLVMQTSRNEQQFYPRFRYESSNLGRVSQGLWAP